MVEAQGASRARIAPFKLLALDAALAVAKGQPGFGMLLDGTYGRDALLRAADHNLWMGRPVEKPGARPLEFEFEGSLAAKLVEWPQHHVVKALCFYHPDDPPEMRARQDRELLRVYDAARALGRELMIEIIAGKHGGLQDSAVARVIAHLYTLGLKPDWWKLETQPDRAAYQGVVDTIKAADPYCRGVVLLGLDAPVDELIAAFPLAASFDLIRGFAIGRTIFARPFQDWLAGRIDDHEAVARMAASFAHFTTAWRKARAARQ